MLSGSLYQTHTFLRKGDSQFIVKEEDKQEEVEGIIWEKTKKTQ